MAALTSLLPSFVKYLPLFHLACTVLRVTAAGGGETLMPQSRSEVTNFTAAVGKTASLSCRVQNLTLYKVAWFHMDRKMLLTLDKMVVTRIPRFSVTQDDANTWTLHIDAVTRDDRGQYMCQVNTEPMVTQSGYLDVVVPPEIVDDLSSGSSVVVQENGNVTLTCHAEGNPKPRISWVREDQRPITISKRSKVVKHEEPTLRLQKVSRRDMGAYLCIASNGVPPSVSKRIELKVQFSPIVLLPNQLMSAPLGSSVWLECKTEAYPRAVTFWKHNHTMVMSTNKYKLEELHHDDYTTTVRLTIKELEKEDFGKYLCYSRNSFGENDGTVELHELTRPQTTTNRMKPPINPEHVNSIDQYPKSGHGGRSQNQVIFNPGEGGGGMSPGRKVSHELGQRMDMGSSVGGGVGGVGAGGTGQHQTSQLGRGSSVKNIISSMMPGNTGSCRCPPTSPFLLLGFLGVLLLSHAAR
ncbi:lachesin-like [Portunus trituberculatus]|uniref:lachesin-like n=1 Tax=Portunus trituberculatus TaxID=210409 RepID=UPI001E1D21F5|nr:lachesin-like [Portunus trituberculatus]